MIAFCNGKTEDEQKFAIDVYTLTRAGQELFGIIETPSNNEYFLDVLHDIETHNKEIVSISIHHINELKDNNVHYKSR